MTKSEGITMEEQEMLLIEVVGESPPVKISVKDLETQNDAGATVLKSVSIDINKGSIVGIVGPSGAGKSTLLRVLNRLSEPPAGTVYLDGRDVTTLDVITLRRRVGMVFQNPVMFEGTVADNVRYGPKLAGKRVTDEEVARFLCLAGLDASFAGRLAGQLSVGEAQRVALARALANQPEVLLLDEPTSALDPVSTRNVEDALKKLVGLTVIVVTHSIKQAQRIANLIHVLADGQIVETLESHRLSEAKHHVSKQLFTLGS